MSDESLRPSTATSLRLGPPPLTGAWRLLAPALRIPALPVQGLVPSALSLRMLPLHTLLLHSHARESLGGIACCG